MSKDYYLRVGQYDFNLADVLRVKNLVNTNYQPPIRTAIVTLRCELEIDITSTDYDQWEKIWSGYMLELTRRYERKCPVDMSRLSPVPHPMETAADTVPLSLQDETALGER